MALTGFWVNGVCAASQAEAVDLINSHWPITTDTFLHMGSGVAHLTNGVLLTTFSMNLSITGSAWISHAMIFYLSPCDPLINNPAFDYVLAGGFWSFAFAFTVGIWAFSKNIGMILKVIKSF